jgi:hypothetical protein
MIIGLVVLNDCASFDDHRLQSFFKGLGEAAESAEAVGMV